MKVIDGFLKFIAVLLATLFVISLVLSFFLYSFEAKAFDAESYKTALLENGIYTRLPAVFGEQLVIMANSGEADSQLSLFKNLTAKEWELFINQLMLPQELQAFGEESVGSVFSLLNGNADVAKISLRSVKANLTSERGVDAVLTLLEAQPPCTATDLFKLANASNGNDIALCNPPKESIPIIKPFIQQQLLTFTASLPDEKFLLQNQKLRENSLKVQSLRMLMRLSPLVPVLLLLVITLLVVRSLRSWLRWWGIPLLTAGGIGIILSFLTKPILRFMLSLQLLGRSSLSSSIHPTELLVDFITSIAQTFVKKVTLLSLTATLIGLVLLIGSTFIKEESKIRN